jgi:hypothetical protein
MVNANDPDVQKKTIETVKACGPTCHTCGKPLQSFSPEVQSSGDLVVKGECGTSGHDAQRYVVE